MRDFSYDDVILPCPFCGGAPGLYNGYCERSGWGDKDVGYILCPCGASVLKPDPYPSTKMSPIADVIAKWNSRISNESVSIIKRLDELLWSNTGDTADWPIRISVDEDKSDDLIGILNEVRNFSKDHNKE